MRIAKDTYNNSDMRKRRFKLPGIATLSAFETAARLGSFTRAAEDLNTSQPAVSRHVGDLEKRLGTHLFRRRSGGLILTQDGTALYRAVRSGLGEIEEAIHGILDRGRAERQTVSLACSYDNAHLIVMPRYAELVDVIGGADLRVMAVEFEHVRELQDEDFDLVLAGGLPADARDRDHRLWQEVVVPVAHPDFWRRHGMPASARDLVNLPLLELSKRNFGWLDWDGWLDAAAGVSAPKPVDRLSNYVYVLEAAAAGRGVALGFAGYYGDYVRLDRLAPATLDPVSTEGGCFAIPNPSSASPGLVRRVIDYLSDGVPGSGPANSRQ